MKPKLEEDDDFPESEEEEAEEEMEEAEQEEETPVKKQVPAKKFVPTPRPQQKQEEAEEWQVFAQPEMSGFRKGQEFISANEVLVKMLNLLEEINSNTK